MRKALFTITLMVMSLVLLGCSNKTYTLSFDSMGGSPVESQELKKDELPVEPDKPTKDGYIFKYWVTNLDTKEKVLFNSPIYENTTVYAYWEEEPLEEIYYKVSFDSMGGTFVSSITVLENETIESPENPEKEGYDFVGWFIEEELFSFETLITKDITLTAKWEEAIEPVNLYDELLLMINNFSAWLERSDFESIYHVTSISEDVKYIYHLKDDVSLKTINYHNGSHIEKMVLVPKDEDTYYVLSKDSSLIDVNHDVFSVEYLGETLKKTFVEEHLIIPQNASITKENDTYTLSFSYEEIHAELLTIFEQELSGYQSYFSSLASTDRIKMQIVIREEKLLTFDIEFGDVFSLVTTFEITNKDLEIPRDKMAQKGVTNSEDYILPLQVNIHYGDAHNGASLNEAYYLVTLEKGYYLTFLRTENYTFYDIEFNEINIDKISETTEQFLFELKEDLTFYLKLSGKKRISFNDQGFIVHFETYTYYGMEGETVISSTYSKEGIYAGEFDPFVVTLKGDMVGYVVTGSATLSAENIRVSNYMDTYYIVKNENIPTDEEYRLFVYGENVSIHIEALDTNDEFVFTDPYVITDEFGPYFIHMFGLKEDTFILDVTEAGWYSLEFETFDTYKPMIFIQGNNVSQMFESSKYLEVGQYTITVDTSSYSKFQIKYVFTPQSL